MKIGTEDKIISRKEWVCVELFLKRELWKNRLIFKKYTKTPPPPFLLKSANQKHISKISKSGPISGN